MTERTRLLARTTPIDEMSPFTVGGGFTGVTMDTNATMARRCASRPVRQRTAMLHPVADRPAGAPATPPGRRAFLDPVARSLSAFGRYPGEEVVVCGRRQADDRLPLKDDTPPDRPMPSNPELTGIGALRAEATPCAAVQRGCQVGFNLLGPALLLANEARIGISKLVDKSRDKSNRLPIALDGPAPAGHLEP
ncbi:hypothetical protein [Sphingomonas paucimobilis]|uniref:hypothetical protein n=1 Tax=Sphingomonas paucimobilis TaxID=13689 RepID=UPI00160232FB|nr:hypothetical protein [Sphingomonas paucimobilis]